MAPTRQPQNKKASGVYRKKPKPNNVLWKKAQNPPLNNLLIYGLLTIATLLFILAFVLVAKLSDDD